MKPSEKSESSQVKRLPLKSEANITALQVVNSLYETYGEFFFLQIETVRR